jgi:hypothetical protein
MKLSRNRWASIYYLIFAATLIGIFVILLQYTTLGDMWAGRSVSWMPMTLLAFACAELSLAFACFADRPQRRPTHWLVLLLAALALVILLGYLQLWVPAAFHLWPAWQIWRSYCEARGQLQAV